MVETIKEVAKNTLGMSTWNVNEHKKSWWLNEIRAKVKTKQTLLQRAFTM